MVFIEERIPDQDRAYLKSIKHKFKGALNTDNENVPLNWIIDRERDEFVLPLGGEGPVYSGHKFVFYQAGEFISFYAERKSRKADGYDNKYIWICSIPAGLLIYPESWRANRDFEIKKENLHQRILEALKSALSTVSSIVIGFEIKIDQNWKGGSDLW